MRHKLKAGRGQLAFKLASVALLTCASVCVPALWTQSQARGGRPRPRGLLATGGPGAEPGLRPGPRVGAPAAAQRPAGRLAPDPAAQDPAPAACERLLWFTCLGGHAAAPDSPFFHFLQVAVLSARRHAPSLAPVLVYGSTEPDRVTRWFESQGGTVVHHTLSFLPDLQRAGNASWSAKLVRMQGAFLRLDIPLVVERIQREGLLDLYNTSTRYALYTDVDAMFLGGTSTGSLGEGAGAGGDFTTCTVPLPSLLGFGPERWRGEAKNSGVLVFNVPAMAAELPAMLQYARDRNFELPAWDQGLLRFYTRDKNRSVLVLPDTFNHKAYWGADPQATILHFHGPKPRQCLACLLRARCRPDWRRVCRGCPPLQLNLWADAPDGGAFYEEVAALFERYLAEAGTLEERPLQGMLAGEKPALQDHMTRPHGTQ